MFKGTQKNRLIQTSGSFEHPKHMFWLRNNKKYFQFHTFIGTPDEVMATLKLKGKPTENDVGPLLPGKTF